jgi:hypothetical protein
VTIGGEMRAAARRGAQSLTVEARGCITAFLESRRCPGGGFRGRSVEADLYYTLFGLECLAALGLPPGRPADEPYLRQFGAGESLDLIHVASLIRCRALAAGGALPASDSQALAAALGRFRAADGGYRLLAGAGESSVYAAFLAAGALDDLGAELPGPEAVVHAVLRRAAPDGGFAGSVGVAGSTTTVTAAAIVLLRRLGAHVPPDAARWLRSQAAGGGFRAAAGAPAPDLLSTASALLALAAAGESVAGFRACGRTFVESLWQDDGGFAGARADPVSDCEYTFHALLALGVLA